MPIYQIKKGSKCLIFKVGSGLAEWKQFKTTKKLEFDDYAIADQGGRWQFKDGEWLIKVAPCFVTVDKSDMPVYSPFKRNKQPFCGISKGKGASRRRNMRGMKRKF